MILSSTFARCTIFHTDCGLGQNRTVNQICVCQKCVKRKQCQYSTTICSYHMGTVVFGALLIAICRVIRLMLEYIDGKLKKYDNALTKCIMCCMKCFFWCLEKFLRMMSNNAYIMCAIYGRSFCPSALHALSLLVRNCLRALALDGVTGFLFFLTKMLVTVGMGALTYYYFNIEENKNQLNHILVPVCVVVPATYLIATVFFQVFSMAVDTLFFCFCKTQLHLY